MGCISTYQAYTHRGSGTTITTNPPPTETQPYCDNIACHGRHHRYHDTGPGHNHYPPPLLSDESGQEYWFTRKATRLLENQGVPDSVIPTIIQALATYITSVAGPGCPGLFGTDCSSGQVAFCDAKGLPGEPYGSTCQGQAIIQGDNFTHAQLKKVEKQRCRSF
jgi:hypothetical protein